MRRITHTTARRFILEKHGLLSQRYKGIQGVIDVVKDAGCLQYDPIDVCGRNAELVLHARVEGFEKSHLDQLLYEQYLLMDQWDKNMAIHLIDDYPFLSPVRKANIVDYEKVLGHHYAVNIVRAKLAQTDSINANDLPFEERVDFFTWRHTRLSQAVLDYLFFKGEAIIHHRNGTIRHYALASHHLPKHVLSQDNIHDSFTDYQAWHLKRRIGATGLLWNKNSDAFLGVLDFKRPAREAAFQRLTEQEKIIKVAIDGFTDYFYMLAEDLDLLDRVTHRTQAIEPRVEFIAPLDHLIWDRKLIKALFDFDYTWEIYTPASKRVYGRYVLPMLYKDTFIGRIALSTDKSTSTLTIEDVWFEAATDEAFAVAYAKKLESFAKFNHCTKIKYLKNTTRHDSSKS